MEFERVAPASAEGSAAGSAVRLSSQDRAGLARALRAFERGDDATALPAFEQLVESGLRFADVHYRIGLIHERQGELDRASRALKQAVRINPGYIEALIALASVCERLGHFEQAQALAERAGTLSQTRPGELDPTTRGKLSNQQAALADALAAAGLRREAIEQYRQALERCPTFCDIRHRLGVALREAGLAAQAIQEFERILDVRPGRAESRVQLGLTHHALGRTRDALREWREVLAREPGHREASMYLRLVAGADTGVPEPTAGWSTVPLASNTPLASNMPDAAAAPRAMDARIASEDGGALFE